MGPAQASWDTHPCWSRYLGRLLALCLSLGALPGRKGGSHLAVSLRAPPNPQAGGVSGGGAGLCPLEYGVQPAW